MTVAPLRRPSPVTRRLLRESAAARPHLALAGLLGALAAALTVAQAVLLAEVIARAALNGATLSQLRGELIALAAVLAARAAVGAGFELSGRLGAIRVMSELRGRLARQLLQLCPGALGAEERTGELAAAAVQGVDALDAYFAGYLPQLVLTTLVPLAVLGFALHADPITAGILTLTVPILILFMVLIGKSAAAQTRRRWRALALLSAHFLDVVQGLPTLRAHRRAAAQAQTLAGVGERYRIETLATLRVAFLSALVLELCAMIGTALVAATIGVQLVAGDIGLQAGLAVLLLAPELYGPLRLVGQQFHASADGSAAAERIFAVLDRPPALAADAADRAVPDPAHEPLRLEGVGYKYPGRPGEVLHALDLELRPGEITALVGPSGAGKSTIARLVLRLADPTTGRVLCGGRDLRELDPDAWWAQVAWIPQRPQLFTGSVAENIWLAAPNASDAEVLDAAEAAGAAGFVAALPQGMATQIGDGARRLSAGQRERIALARAFLADAPLLVLDEPTAHLDTDSAQVVGEALERLARGRTTLLIAHDPALAERADRVLRLDSGWLLAPEPAPLAVPA
ncbi:MAG TPA: thiol reductant ABC exporter subunit CydD [Solirubrobacteraceae bacterium]|nr:thiol reductant ABC exporter subunit CydD [Solirubrobacteraceae bacterium]